MVEKRASRKKHHVVYKTTCIETGRFYIGLHSTDNLDDGYLGSGMRLIRSVRKYGPEKHVREILEHHSTRQAASEREKQLITPELRKNPLCMNCGAGGLGAIDRPPTSEETRAKLSEASKRYVRTPEWYEKIVASRKAGAGYNHDEEVRRKISQAQIGKKLSEEHKQKISEGGTGLKRSEETRKNISKALKGKSKVLPPFSEAHREAIRRARLGKKHSEAAKANMRKSKDMSKNKRPCTVDGINIFASVGELVKALGSGKTGARSPTFRYVEKPT